MRAVQPLVQPRQLVWVALAGGRTQGAAHPFEVVYHGWGIAASTAVAAARPRLV